MIVERSEETFWNPARLARVGRALLLALAVAVIVTYVSDSSGTSMVRAGDFPGFYVLAEILHRGESLRLYDPVLQQQIESELWPAFGGAFYMSVYPPYTAALLYPLALLGPTLGQIVFIAIMLSSFLLFLRILHVENITVEGRGTIVAALLLWFAPLTAGIFAAQNTALSVLLLTGAASLLARESVKRSALSGALLGLWMFKPQFPPFAIIAATLIGGRRSVIVGVAAVGVVYYLLALSIAGMGWETSWFSAITKFGTENFIANRRGMVSLTGSLRAISYALGASPGDMWWSGAGLVGMVLSLVVFFVVTKLFLVARADRSGEMMKRALLALGAALPLISPQTLFYDLGIAVGAWVMLHDLRSPRTLGILAGLALASNCAFLLRPSVEFPLFFPFALYLGISSLRAAGNPLK